MAISSQHSQLGHAACRMHRMILANPEFELRSTIHTFSFCLTDPKGPTYFSCFGSFPWQSSSARFPSPSHVYRFSLKLLRAPVENYLAFPYLHVRLDASMCACKARMRVV
eukprot:3247515-Pleurochrysis_carterae.AAC.4